MIVFLFVNQRSIINIYKRRKVIIMIPRIKKLETKADYKLVVSFDSGETVVYDVNDDILNIPDFSVLKTEKGLFENAQIDESRTCVFWNDRVDLASDTLLEYGRRV